MTIDMEYYRKINGLFGTTDKKDYLQKQAIKSVNKTNDSVLSTFEILINSNYAENIIADGINTKGIFDYSKNTQEVKTKTELASYMKELWIEVGSSNVGSVVKHTDKISLIENTYIVVSKQEDMDGYDVCYIQKSNNTLKFYDENSILYDVPCIVSSNVTLNSTENNYMTLPDKTFIVIAQNTSETIQIVEGMRFILGINAYKVDSIEDVSVIGLLHIRMSFSQKNSGDDFVNRIAVQTSSTSNIGGGW